MKKTTNKDKKDDKSDKCEKNKKERKLLVLLDSHAIIHRAYHALPEFASSKGVPTGALFGLSTMLMSLLEKFKPNYIVACYDLPQPTYRHEAYDGYKAGRKKTDDALVEQLKSSRDIFKAFDIPMYDMPGFEADDMLGTIVEEVLVKYDNVDIVIASGDMDTLQLVSGDRVRVFTLKKGIKDTVIYNEKAVVERFGFEPKYLPDYKGLRGDPSDNIIGISGIGEKTATTLISEFHTIENMYQVMDTKPAKFKELGISDRVIDLLDKGRDESLFSKMLATIRRDAPIDFVIPEKEWKEVFSIQKAEDVFREYDFRSIIARLKQFSTGKINGVSSSGSTGGQSGGDKNDSEGGEEGNEAEEMLFKGIDPILDKKLKIAVWLLNSSITNPTLEDVFAVTRNPDANESEKILLEQIKKAGLEKVYFDIELPLLPILEKMEKVGVKINVDFLKTLGRDYHKKLSTLDKNIQEMADVEFNVNSPKQLAEVLFEKMQLGVGAKNLKKTAGGARSTKESELEKMREMHPIIGKILEYRELAKLLGTYIDVIPTLVDSNARLHTTFLQTGASTGRMASQNPGIQNIPIKTEQGRAIRHAFVCDDGYTLISFDYSQIELRIAAILSGDEKFVEIFKSGIDVHTGVASKVFGVKEKDVTKEMRRKAKVINFGILYGMGVNALKANLGSTREEAQTFYNEYFKNFSGLAQYLEETKVFAMKNGYTETLFGRRRYFEGIKSKLPFIRAAAERMAINAPIQGTSADIIKISMKRVDDKLAELGLGYAVRPLLQVHDELIYEVRTPEVKKVARIIKGIMENVFKDDGVGGNAEFGIKDKDRGVPIVTSANAGKNWGELEPLEL